MNDDLYVKVCKPQFDRLTGDQKETQGLVVEVLNKLKNGINERLDNMEKRLDKMEIQIDKLQGLIVKLLFAVMGVFGSLIVGLALVLIRGLLG